MKDDEDSMNLFTLFRCCKDAALFLARTEAQMYEQKVLSCDRKPEPLLKLERMLYELASDPQLTGGVFYAISISFQEPGAQKRMLIANIACYYLINVKPKIRRYISIDTLTRYIESGCYDGFFESDGRRLIEQSLGHDVVAYKVYCHDDFVECKFSSKSCR